ncbi:MAG: hypothetical protein II470_09985 [Selenomonas sp.]|nr:hypothetical protein [Selenomonas sp.]
MEPQKIKVEDLPSNEFSVLKQLYGPQIEETHGYSRNKITYVRELSGEEKTYFHYRNAMNPVGSVMQGLYKVKGNLLPTYFNRALYTLIQETEALRLNYCSVGKRILAVVLDEQRDIPQVVYRNLESMDGDELDVVLRRIMEAELRQGFDLRSGSLVRFSVLHTNQYEFAVVVTAVGAIMSQINLRKLFALAVNESYKPAEDGNGIKGMSDAALAEPIKEYWRNFLKDFPQQPELPYYHKSTSDLYKQEAYVSYIPADLLAELRLRSKDKKMMLMAILHTAWGILLQRYNQRDDVGFALFVPRRGKAADEGITPSLVPVRLQVKGNPTVQELVTKAFQQFVISQPYASLGRENIEDVLRSQANGFDHVLNFCDFFQESMSYADVPGQATGQLVMQNSYDGRDLKLSISFRREENKVIISLVYDSGEFKMNDVKRLLKEYQLIIQQMMMDWNVAVYDFRAKLEKRLEAERISGSLQVQDSRAVLQNYLSKLALFQECELGIQQLFMGGAQQQIMFEGDRIDADSIEDNMIFLVSGKIVRSIEVGDGWYNTLDIQKENSWLNESVLLPGHRNKYSMEVLTEQAVIIKIPLSGFMAILKRYPQVGQNIFRHVIRQLEKYQRLWIQS